MTERTDGFLSPNEIPILRRNLQMEKAPEDIGIFKPTDGPKRKLKVFIALPNLSTIHIRQAKNLWEWCKNRDIEFMWYAPEGIVPHDRARNACVKRFLHTNPPYEVMLWVDAFTVLPKPNTLYRLLATMNNGVCENCGHIWDITTRCCDEPKRAEVDMIAAVPQTYQMTKEGVPTLVPIAYRWDKEKEGYYQYWTKKPGKIDHVDVSTVACTVVRHKVMKDVRRPAFKFTMKDEWGIAGYGEDFYFCEGVRKAGYRIWADYSIVAHHFLKLHDTRETNDTLIRELDAKLAAIKQGDRGVEA